MWLGSISTWKAQPENTVWQKTNNPECSISSLHATYGFPLESQLRAPSFFWRKLWCRMCGLSWINQNCRLNELPHKWRINRCIAMSLIIAFWCCLLTLQKAHIMMLTWNPIMQMHCTAGSVWPLGYFIIQPICLTKTKTFWPKNIFYLQAVKMINGFASTGLNMKCETKQ